MKHLITVKNLDVNYVPHCNSTIYINNKSMQTVKTPLLKAIKGNDVDLFESIIKHPSFEKDEFQLEIARKVAFNKSISIKIFLKLVDISGEFNFDINSPIKNQTPPFVAAIQDNFNINRISAIINHLKFDSTKSDISSILFLMVPLDTMNLIYDFDCKHDHLINGKIKELGSSLLVNSEITSN